MGNRAQVLIKSRTKGSGLYLYDHFGALDHDIVKTVHTAMRQHKSWDDSEYLAAIIFRQMLEDCSGVGLGAKQKNDIELLVTVDCRSRMIRIDACAKSEDRDKLKKTLLGRYSFDEFARLRLWALLKSIGRT